MEIIIIILCMNDDDLTSTNQRYEANIIQIVQSDYYVREG